MRIHANAVWGAVLVAVVTATWAAPHLDRATDEPGVLGHVPLHIVTLDVIAFACDHHADGVCIGYGGQVPAAPLVGNRHDTWEVTVTNRIAETVVLLDVSDEVKADLSDARISFHSHGTSLPQAFDGVGAVPGTEVIDSSIGPGESLTHTFTTPWDGSWHFHDHVMGLEGAHGVERGLYGSIVILPPAKHSDQVLDLHLLNDGANSGGGLDVTITKARFDLNVVGLGDRLWDVVVRDPSGALVQMVTVGPGVSHLITVLNPDAGAYTWEAFASGGGYATGTIEVVA